MENSNLGWLGESLKLKSENESKLAINSILGHLHEKVEVCLLQVRLHDLTYSSNFKVSDTGVVVPRFVVHCLSSTLCRFQHENLFLTVI